MGYDISSFLHSWHIQTHLTNCSKSKYQNKPIIIRSHTMQHVPNAGKCTKITPPLVFLLKGKVFFSLFFGRQSIEIHLIFRNKVANNLTQVIYKYDFCMMRTEYRKSLGIAIDHIIIKIISFIYPRIRQITSKVELWWSLALVPMTTGLPSMYSGLRPSLTTQYSPSLRSLMTACRLEIFHAGPSKDKSTSTWLSAVDLPTVIWKSWTPNKENQWHNWVCRQIISKISLLTGLGQATGMQL